MTLPQRTYTLTLSALLASLIMASIFIMNSYKSNSNSETNLSINYPQSYSYPSHCQKSLLSSSTSSGSFHKGNYVYGGAMNICWNTLAEDVIQEPIQLQVESDEGKRLFESLANSKFSKKDLSPHSYYAKAGYGQQTLNIINKEVKIKFPTKTFPPLEFQLNPADIISYAYFIKQVQYLYPFTIKPHFYFKGQPVKGFIADEVQQFENIRVCKYINDEEFILKLLLKDSNQELYIVKGMEGRNPQDVVMEVKKNSQNSQPLQDGDSFGMPVLDIDVRRDYSQLIGGSLLNKNFRGYSISKMFENIKFKMDEKGAKVENQAVIVMERMMKISSNRHFNMDSPFWIVMKEKGKEPYLVVGINNKEFMESANSGECE